MTFFLERHFSECAMLFHGYYFCKFQLYRGTEAAVQKCSKRCPENMLQIYSWKLKAAGLFKYLWPFSEQLYLSHTLAWVFSCKYAVIFGTPFPKNTSGRLLLKVLGVRVKYELNKNSCMLFVINGRFVNHRTWTVHEPCCRTPIRYESFIIL